MILFFHIFCSNMLTLLCVPTNFSCNTLCSIIISINWTCIEFISLCNASRKCFAISTIWFDSPEYYWGGLNVLAPFTHTPCCTRVTNGSYDAISITSSEWASICSWDATFPSMASSMLEVSQGWLCSHGHHRSWSTTLGNIFRSIDGSTPIIHWATTSIGGTHWARIWGCGKTIGRYDEVIMGCV